MSKFTKKLRLVGFLGMTNSEIADYFESLEERLNGHDKSVMTLNDRTVRDVVFGPTSSSRPEISKERVDHLSKGLDKFKRAMDHYRARGGKGAQPELSDYEATKL